MDGGRGWEANWLANQLVGLMTGWMDDKWAD